MHLWILISLVPQIFASIVNFECYDPPLNCQNFIPPPSCFQTIDNFKGRILTQNSTDYNLARMGWTVLTNPQPYIIAQVANYEDVSAAILHARKCCLKITIRSGGHSISNFGMAGQLVIDVRLLKNLAYNPNAETVTVQVGNQFREMVEVLSSTPFYIIAGSCPMVSMSGYVVSGGLGIISRKFGLEVDHLLEAKVVLANGQLTTISDKVNPELFWAISGGGSSFGVAVEYTIRMFRRPSDKFIFKTLIWGLNDAPLALSALTKIIPESDGPSLFDNVQMFTYFTRLGATPQDPLGFIAHIFYNGPIDEGTTLLSPLMATLPPPSFGEITEFRTWKQVQYQFEITPVRFAVNGKTFLYKEKFMSVEQATLIRDAFLMMINNYWTPLCFIDLYLYGGAIGRRDPTRVSFPPSRRAVRWVVSFFQSFDRYVTQTQLQEIRPIMVAAYNSTRSLHLLTESNCYSVIQATYMGYQDFSLGDSWPIAYHGENFDRLAEIKKKYDPNLIFNGWLQAIGNQGPCNKCPDN